MSSQFNSVSLTFMNFGGINRDALSRHIFLNLTWVHLLLEYCVQFEVCGLLINMAKLEKVQRKPWH